MAKVRIGHFVEAQVLEALEVDYIDESEVLTMADEDHHINKSRFKTPFVCGCRDLGEALVRVGKRQNWNNKQQSIRAGMDCNASRVCCDCSL